MNLSPKKRVTLEDFYNLREGSDELLEYINGIVYMLPSPSTKHQRISMRLGSDLFGFLRDKPCEVFSAPFDIELSRDGSAETQILIPDLTVICDKAGLTEQKYVGVPTLIMEILSPSNQSHDLVTKLNLYMAYGVKEYWIIDPMSEGVLIYKLSHKDEYELDMATRTATSTVLDGFSIDVTEWFSFS